MASTPQQQDIRWKQRFSNYQKALSRLVEAIELSQKRHLSMLEQQGLIKAFEFTQELAWKVMKDFFQYQGNSMITGSRDAIREAFKNRLIEDGEGWLETITSRNQTAQTYDEETALAIIETITARYLKLFTQFSTQMQQQIDASSE